MKARPVHLLVCAGNKGAEEVLRSELAQYGFDSFASLRFAHDITARAEPWDAELKAFLEAVGYDLMVSALGKERGQSPSAEEVALCRERAFGYGNVGALVTTTDSVPTATVTAVWSPGIYNGMPWMPLVLRRNKLRHLVLC